MYPELYSRFEFQLNEQSIEDFYDEYRNISDEIIIGLSPQGKYATIDTLSKEVHVFLALKFAGRKDVIINIYTNIKEIYG